MVHREQTIQARQGLFAAACAIIERDAHLGSLGLKSVADELGVSGRQLQRVFAGSGRTSFRAYVDAIRMERAVLLLREELPTRAVPVRSVREVAAMVGYNQPANFAKAFRRYWGTPPHRWRQPTDAATDGQKTEGLGYLDARAFLGANPGNAWPGVEQRPGTARTLGRRDPACQPLSDSSGAPRVPRNRNSRL